MVPLHSHWQEWHCGGRSCLVSDLQGGQDAHSCLDSSMYLCLPTTSVHVETFLLTFQRRSDSADGAWLKTTWRWCWLSSSTVDTKTNSHNKVKLSLSLRPRNSLSHLFSDYPLMIRSPTFDKIHFEGQFELGYYDISNIKVILDLKPVHCSEPLGNPVSPCMTTLHHAIHVAFISGHLQTYCNT